MVCCVYFLLLLSGKLQGKTQRQSFQESSSTCRRSFMSGNGGEGDNKTGTKAVPAAAAVDFARLIGRLKTTPRTGWVRRGVPRYESVADHSWRVAALAFLLQQDELNLSKCVSLAVVHDMAECVVGDIAPDDNVSKQDKQRMEQEAMEQISTALQKATSIGQFCESGDDGDTTKTSSTSKKQHDDNNINRSGLMDLFHEYETRETPESKAVKDLDLLDMIVQADEYERTYSQLDLSDFFHSTPPSRFQNERLRQIAQELHAERQQRLDKAAAVQQPPQQQQQQQQPPSKRQKLDPQSPPPMEQQQCVDIQDASSRLSEKDVAFVSEFGKASKLNSGDIASVVRALRDWENRATKS